MTLIRSNNLPATHPGLIFRSRIINRHNLTISDAAQKMRISRSHLNNFANGKVSVTVSFAMKLETATGLSTAFWINLQKVYNLYTNQDLIVDCEPLFNFKIAKE